MNRNKPTWAWASSNECKLVYVEIKHKSGQMSLSKPKKSLNEPKLGQMSLNVLRLI